MKQTFPLIIFLWVFFTVTHDSARAGILQNQAPEDTVSFTPEDRFRFIEVKGHSGAHLGYDYYFWRMCVRLQAGSYLHKRGHRMKENYFFRPALQYNPENRMFVQVGLKTRAGFRADWIEFGLGFRI